MPSVPFGPQGQLIASNFGGLRLVKVVINDSALGSAAVLDCLACFNIAAVLILLHILGLFAAVRFTRL